MRFKAKPGMKAKFKKRDKGLAFRKKVCRLCAAKVKAIDYKDLRTLDTYIKERGKMVSARVSGNCARHQRMLSRAIKQARFIALLPYVRY
jgi:small subunit ribosomal protein S18